MNKRVGGTVATRVRGMMQLSGDQSPPVPAIIRIEYEIGADVWSLVVFNVRVILKRCKDLLVSCEVCYQGEKSGPLYPCKIIDDMEKNTWQIKVLGPIGLWVSVPREAISETVGKGAVIREAEAGNEDTYDKKGIF